MSLLVRDLRKRYGRIWALRGVSLEVERGHAYALVAPNGSGKTTLIKSIVGLVRPSGGEILVDGRSNLERGAKRVLHYTPEVPEAPPWIRVRDLLVYSGRLYGLSRLDADREARRVARELGFEGLLWRRLGGLSKGQRKRVLIAAGLIPWSSPGYYLLDEPFSGLDPEGISAVRSVVSGFSRDSGVLVSSHILRELEDVVDRVVIMYLGRILYSGSLEDLASRVMVKPYLAVRTRSPGEAARVLEEAGYRVLTVTRAGLRVALESQGQASEIISLLESHGISVEAYSVSKGSLEEAYLELINRARRGELGA